MTSGTPCEGKGSCSLLQSELTALKGLSLPASSKPLSAFVPPSLLPYSPGNGRWPPSEAGFSFSEALCDSPLPPTPGEHRASDPGTLTVRYILQLELLKGATQGPN